MVDDTIRQEVNRYIKKRKKRATVAASAATANDSEFGHFDSSLRLLAPRFTTQKFTSADAGAPVRSYVKLAQCSAELLPRCLGALLSAWFAGDSSQSQLATCLRTQSGSDR